MSFIHIITLSFAQERIACPVLPLSGVPNLWMVQSLDCKEIAKTLDTHVSLNSSKENRLKVLVQVNTSREPSEYLYQCMKS